MCLLTVYARDFLMSSLTGEINKTIQYLQKRQEKPHGPHEFAVVTSCYRAWYQPTRLGPAICASIRVLDLAAFPRLLWIPSPHHSMVVQKRPREGSVHIHSYSQKMKQKSQATTMYRTGSHWRLSLWLSASALILRHDLWTYFLMTLHYKKFFCNLLFFILSGTK